MTRPTMTRPTTPLASPLVIVGLDGASFNLLDRLSRRGDTPNLDRLRSDSIEADLYSTVPPVTFPAWTSFLTGLQPAQHGVTDLLHRRGYDLVPMQAHLRGVPTWLHHASAAGYSVCALGVPGTYPPEPVDGIVIAGFDAPGAYEAGPAAVYPPGFIRDLRALGGWRYAVFNENRRKQSADLADACDALIADIGRKEAVTMNIARRRPWDVFFVHMQASDTAGHHLWHTFDQSSPRYRGGLEEAIPRIFSRLDRFIGRLCSWARQRRARVMLVSDHGMVGASAVAVHLNRWLQSEGHLQFRPSLGRSATRGPLRQALALVPPRLSAALRSLLPDAAFAGAVRAMHSSPVDWRRCAAFSFELDYHPAIWLHHRGQFPGPHAPHLSPAAQTRLLEEICAGLYQLRDPQGRAVVRRVWRREELARQTDATHADRLPDLTIEPDLSSGYRPSFLPSSGDSRQPAVRRLGEEELNAPRGFGMPGQHRPAGVFIFAGPGVAPGHLRQSDSGQNNSTTADQPADFDIASAGAFVAGLLGLPMPRTLPESLLPYVRPSAISVPKTSHDTIAASNETTHPLANEAFAERLRVLGYID